MFFTCHIYYKIEIQKNINYTSKTHVTSISDRIYENLIEPISPLKKFLSLIFVADG